VSDPRRAFYEGILRRLLDAGLLRRNMSVLVTCGGDADCRALRAAGFTDVTITNVDRQGEAGAAAPYRWELQDAEALTYGDGSFDLAIVAAGLHHCRSPHRALLEMYRVARAAVIAIESRDSALMRLAVRLGAVDEYEVGAVAAHGLRAGGVANTAVPNYVYRWTEREVEKTVASYAPHARHRFRWFREFELPEVLLQRDRGLRGRLLRLARPAIRVVTRVAPSQANLLAFVVEKPRLPDDLQPWMSSAEEPDARAVGRRYAIER
jgi:ubiquinone/menaquinone biosynthesis C-methylase UbiE